MNSASKCESHRFAVLRIKFTTPWISKSRKINRILDHRESIANIWIRTQLIFLQACRFAELRITFRKKYLLKNKSYILDN